MFAILGPFSSSLERSAADAWREIAPKAGLTLSGWNFEPISKRENGRSSTIVLLAEHENGVRYALRHQAKPIDPDAFERHYRMQVSAFDAFPRSPSLIMPRPIIADPDLQTSLSEYCDGAPLSDLMRLHEGDVEGRLALLRRAGAWLDAFHRCQIVERRKFQTKYTTNRYKRVRDEILAGRRDVAAEQSILQGIEYLLNIAADYTGQETVSARQHGDLHMRNLIVSEDRVAGIDVTKSDGAPVGFDVAKLLLDYASVIEAGESASAGQILSRDAKDAFFDGYTLVGPDDPSVNFLMVPRVLATLMRIPKQEGDRSPANRRTLKVLRTICDKAFRAHGT